jgi:competence protein ComEC
MRETGFMKTDNPVPSSERSLAGPAMKAALFFSAGILAAARLPVHPAFFLAALLLCLILLILGLGKDFTGNIAAGGVLLAAGALALSVQQRILAPVTVPDTLKSGALTVTGEVYGDARFRNGSTFFTLRCRTISGNSGEFRQSGLLPCTVYGQTAPLAPGTELRLTGKVRKILQPFAELSLLRSPGPVRSKERLAVSSVPGGLSIIREKQSLTGIIRDTLAGCAARYEFGGGRDLLLAMTIGDVRELPPETRETFTRSGIAHLLAVSGLNIGVAAAAIVFLLSFLPIGKKTVMAVTGLLLFAYTGVCGFQPPVTRAFIMALMVMGAYFLERRKDIENSLFGALLLVLAFDPQALGGASLQLSFAAVWALILFYSPVMALFSPAMKLFPRDSIRQRILRYPLGLMIATLLSTIATSPIAAAHFGLFPLLSLPANLIAVPLAELITILGIPTLGFTALGPFFAPPADALAGLTSLLIRLLTRIAEYAAHIPLASVEVANLPFLYIAGGGLGLFFLSRSAGRPVFQKGLVYLSLVLLTIWTWQPAAEASRLAARRSATFFDVGQGDAALVECRGRSFLIDAGPGYDGYAPAETILLPSLRARGVNRLDGLFITHFDADHSGGLHSIMERMKVRRLYCRESMRDSLRAIYGERVDGLAAGDSLAFPGGGIFVLAPSPASGRARNENARSLVLRADIGESRILFTGDIDPEGQNGLLSWGCRLDADIFTVPHHGAAGLDRSFLRAVHPRSAVISCGLNNRYGHPAESTLLLLGERGSRVLRTDRDGTLSLGSNLRETIP